MIWTKTVHKHKGRTLFLTNEWHMVTYWFWWTASLRDSSVFVNRMFFTIIHETGAFSFKLFILCLALYVNEWKSSSRNQNVVSLIGTLQLIHVTDETGASTWNRYINNLRHSTRLKRPQILSTTSYSQIKRFFFLIVTKQNGCSWLQMTTERNRRFTFTYTTGTFQNKTTD